MRITIEVDLNNIPYDADINEVIGYLQAYIQETYQVDVDMIVDDYDFVNKIDLGRQLKAVQGGRS